MESITYLLATLALLTTPASAFWRLPCRSPLVVERADPIVAPGKVSGHVHTIMGGNAFSFNNMSYADTQTSTCSSCAVVADLSNYWVPKLYYHAQNGSFIDVPQSGGAMIYYLLRIDSKDVEYGSSQPIHAFPQGFTMLAGNPSRRTYNGSSLADQAVSYACLGANSGSQTPGFPNYNCPGGLRSQVFFPSCWDGRLNSPDQSHVAYPSRSDSGYCPSTHPKRLVSLFYEVIWNVNAFKDMWYGDSQPFIYATGDTTGYSNHGDFVNGWDVSILQKAVDTCTNNSGNLSDCPVLSNQFDSGTSQSCRIAPRVNERVTGVLDALPGCNPVSTGPGLPAVKTCSSSNTATISPPIMDHPDLTTSLGYAYLGCGYDPGSPRSLTGKRITLPNMTNTMCVQQCKALGYTYAGSEYSTQCYCGNTIDATRLPTPGLMGTCNMACGGADLNAVVQETCGGSGRMSLYKACNGTQACVNADGSGGPVSSSKIRRQVMSAISRVRRYLISE